MGNADCIYTELPITEVICRIPEGHVPLARLALSFAFHGLSLCSKALKSQASKYEPFSANILSVIGSSYALGVPEMDVFFIARPLLRTPVLALEFLP